MEHIQPSNALELRQVSCHLGSFSLQDLNLTLPSGTILGLVGENGAGKTTAIRLIMNTLHRDSGDIRVLGCDNTSPEFLSIKEDIGVVLDEAYFPEVLTAKEVGGIMADTYAQWDSAQYQTFLTRFQLPGEKPFKAYSKGMKMKLAIAVAMSHHPRLLILDEATTGLDPLIRDEILTVFSEFTREPDHSILISSHITSDLEKLCDYVAFLHQGQLLFCEEKDRLLDTCGMITGTEELLESLQPEAIIARQESQFGGIRVLVRKDLIPPTFSTDPVTLEEIVLFAAKGAEEA